MSNWTKWLLVAALIAVPTVGYGVAKHRAHRACPVSPDCPCANSKHGPR
jgi:hypothetical protein